MPNPFCIISLNQVKVARTKVNTGPDPLWDEEFILDDVPPDVLTFTITVYNKGKRSKDTEVAEMTVDLSSLVNGDEVIFLQFCYKIVFIVVPVCDHMLQTRNIEKYEG